MSFDSVSIVSDSESDVFDVLSITRSVAATAPPTASPQSCDIAPASAHRLAEPQPATKLTAPHKTPLAQSFSTLLSDVDA